MLPIPGTSTVSHLQENVGAATIDLTADQFRQVDAAI
jgi:aryl-alcohol dehydrogenase-like predicted oxidoreductase